MSIFYLVIFNFNFCSVYLRSTLFYQLNRIDVIALIRFFHFPNLGAISTLPHPIIDVLDLHLPLPKDLTVIEIMDTVDVEDLDLAKRRLIITILQVASCL